MSIIHFQALDSWQVALSAVLSLILCFNFLFQVFSVHIYIWVRVDSLRPHLPCFFLRVTFICMWVHATWLWVIVKPEESNPRSWSNGSYEMPMLGTELRPSEKAGNVFNLWAIFLKLISFQFYVNSGGSKSGCQASHHPHLYLLSHLTSTILQFPNNLTSYTRNFASPGTEYCLETF